MKKKFVRLISAVLSAAMTLTAVPLSAFAEGEAHTHDGESNVITTPLDFRETADENGAGWSWDYDTKTLTLDGVNIQATTEENMMSVVTVPDGTEIVLNGNNTIVQTDTGKSDTYVLSAVNNKEVNCGRHNDNQRRRCAECREPLYRQYGTLSRRINNPERRYSKRNRYCKDKFA